MFVGQDEIEIANKKEEMPVEKNISAESYSQTEGVPIRPCTLAVHDGNPEQGRRRAGRVATSHRHTRWLYTIANKSKEIDMNSNQRSQGNNQSNNGGNERAESSSRGPTDKNNERNEALSQQSQQSASQQSGQRNSEMEQDSNQMDQDDPSWGREGKAQPTGADQAGNAGNRQSGQQGSQQQGSQQQGAMPSTDRTGSQTGSMQGASPHKGHMAADQKMDDDTGLSNTANRQSAENTEGDKQTQQSNVGRRSDMTAD